MDGKVMRVRMARRMALSAAALVSIIVCAPGGAGAGPATDALRPAVDKVLRILEDPALKGEARTVERREALRRVMEGAIDFPEAARRALGTHWRARTEPERDEFIRLFKDLVTYSYIRVMEPYAGEKVLFVGESETEGTTTMLTRIQRSQREPVPVDYRMHLRGSRWLIYDVVVEGTSLVGNYRVQFNTIMRTASYEELVRRIKVRVAELTHGPAAANRAVPRSG